jgi:hypothetical protein
MPQPDTSYWAVSRRPLQILAFILPLLALYQLGLVATLRGEGEILNLAHIRLIEFFRLFGVNPALGLHLGGAAIVVILLTWHTLTGQPWRISGRALLIMAAEAVALTLPLLVLGHIVVGSADTALAAADGRLPKNVLSLLTVSVGAGLFEELVFRMTLIGALLTLLVDVAKASPKLGAGIAVTVAAAAFAWYHDFATIQQLLFYFFAGLYFGAVFLLRGFGIVVGTHALYNVVIVLWWAAT